MSSMGQLDPTTEQQKQQGAETFLSPEERKQVQRLLGHPTDYPKALGSWINEFLKVNPVEVPRTITKSAPRFIGANGELQQVDSTTAETTVFTQKIPGRTIGKNGHLTSYLFMTARDDAGNTLDLTVRFKLGGTTVCTAVIGASLLDGSDRVAAFQAVITNANSYSNQFGMVTGVKMTSSGQSIVGAGSATVDSSQDQDFTITFQWGTANVDNRARKYYASAEVFNPIGAS